jgi:hypothetical protein
MWSDIKADSILGSGAHLLESRASKGKVYLDANSRINQYTLDTDPWSDPGSLNQVFDLQDCVRSQLKSTVLKVLCTASGIGEVSWSAADRNVLGVVAEVYKTVEEKCSSGMGMLLGPVDVSFPADEHLLLVSASSTRSNIADETAQLRDRLVRVERELFDMRNQVARLVAQATSSFTTAQIVARVDYNPAEAWQKAIERDSTTSPVLNLEELYE